MFRTTITSLAQRAMALGMNVHEEAKGVFTIEPRGVCMMNAPDTGAVRVAYTCPKCHRTTWNPNDVAHLYCGACCIFAEDLRDEPVTMFAHLTPMKLTRRDGFSLALFTLLESAGNHKARLVHGIVRDSFNPDQYVQHAWCEFPATYDDEGTEGPSIVVIDYSQLDEGSHIVPRDLYYAQYGAQKTQLFTLIEALDRAVKYRSHGPWPDSPSLRDKSPNLVNVRSTSEE